MLITIPRTFYVFRLDNPPGMSSTAVRSSNGLHSHSHLDSSDRRLALHDTEIAHMETADTVKKLDMLAPLVARNLDKQIPQSL